MSVVSVINKLKYKHVFLIEMWLLSSKAAGGQNAAASVKLMRFRCLYFKFSHLPLASL